MPMLISKDYATGLRKTIDPKKASKSATDDIPSGVKMRWRRKSMKRMPETFSTMAAAIT